MSYQRQDRMTCQCSASQAAGTVIAIGWRDSGTFWLVKPSAQPARLEEAPG